MIQTHYLSFRDPPNCPLFQYIIDGVKTVEGRKYSDKYKIGDIIVFQRENDSITCRIIYVNKYRDVEQYLRRETLTRALPCVRTYKEGIKIYNTFTTAKERSDLRDKYGYGFIGIGIELISKN